MWEEMRKIKMRMEEQDRKERKNKIVIRGLKMKNNETKKKVEEFIEEEFNIKDRISRVEIRGRGEECNIAIVEMRDWGTKQTVMEKKKRLTEKKVYIDHDLTREEMII